jgi:hypothetical protein
MSSCCITSANLLQQTKVCETSFVGADTRARPSCIYVPSRAERFCCKLGRQGGIRTHKQYVLSVLGNPIPVTCPQTWCPRAESNRQSQPSQDCRFSILRTWALKWRPRRESNPPTLILQISPLPIRFLALVQQTGFEPVNSAF